MLAKLMLRQKTIMPVEQMVTSSMAIDWADEMSPKELLAARLRKLKRTPEDVEQENVRVKEAHAKNKKQFDQTQ